MTTIDRRRGATVGATVFVLSLNTPWGLAFLPDGRLLATERTVNVAASSSADVAITRDAAAS